MTQQENKRVSTEPSSMVIGEIYKTIRDGSTSIGRIPAESIMLLVSHEFPKRDNGIHELKFIYDTKEVIIKCFDVTFLERLSFDAG